MSKLCIAKSAGFCFGVSRAVKMAEDALNEGPCFCLGEIIHNHSEVERLIDRGLLLLDNAENASSGDRVIVRSHGISRSEKNILSAQGANIVDATCPRVSHIHKIVSDACENGRIPVIIGECSHPEVKAICGWCTGAKVFSDGDEFRKWLEEDPNNCEKPLSIVFQTTQTQKNLEICRNLIKNMCTNANLFDTICGATFSRQREARLLSAKCDAMVVIGGKHSANSLHLAELCSEQCGNVQFIETADELDTEKLKDAGLIGITAGASTPAWIIKEVKHKMSDEIKIEEIATENIAEETAPAVEEAVEAAAETPVKEETVAVESVNAEPVAEPPVKDGEKSFDEMLEDSIKTIYNGDTVTGIVTAITATEVSVDLGTKHSGYIPVEDFTAGGAKIEDVIKVGDTIDAVVVRVNDVEGTVTLSKKRLDAVRGWNDIEAAQQEGTVVEGKVTEDNKGGVVVSVSGIRVFVPASQTGLGKDVPMSEMVGQTVRLKITEVNRGRRRVVGSIRVVANRERRERAEQVWNEIEVGKHYEGVVKSMTSYGAFVDIGGVDGMVHVSELSWSRIKQPSDVLAVGDKIDVYVINFDKETRKISLGHRNPDDNPWVKFTAAYEVGSVAPVKIVKLMPFGAFAEVMPGVDGLIHISQIANRRIGKPDEVLTVGDVVDAKITNIDNEKQKISLSIRALTAPAPAPVKEEKTEVVEKDPEPMEDALVYEISATGEAKGFIPDVE